MLLEEQGDRIGAEAAYRRADQRGDANGAFNLGVLLEARENLAAAEDAYKRADERGHAAAAANLGVLLEEKGDRIGAEAAYRRADQRGEANGAFNLGVLLEERDEFAEAEDAYRRAEEMGNANVAQLARVALRELSEAMAGTGGGQAAERRVAHRPRMVHRPRAVGHRHQALARDSNHDRIDHGWAAIGTAPATDITSRNALDPELMPAPDQAVVPDQAIVADQTAPADQAALPARDQRAATSAGPPNVLRLATGLRELQLENVHPLRLRLLLEIERTGSISSAAEACSIAQPSASMHVRTLETATGQRLVSRHGRGSRLTAAGRVVASHADRVLATLDSMRRALDALDGRVGGELILAATLTPSLHLLPSILRTYSERYPGVTVNLRTTPSQNVIQEVVRGGAEIGFAAEVPTGEPVIGRQIDSDELVGIAAPGVVRFDDGGVTLGELARHTLLVGSEASSTRSVTERCLGGAGFRPTRVWVFDSYDAITRAVADGLGVSFTSRLLVRESVQRGELVAFRLLGLERMLRPIYALQSRVRELTPEGAAFMEFLATPPWSADEQAAPPAVSGNFLTGILVCEMNVPILNQR